MTRATGNLFLSLSAYGACSVVYWSYHNGFFDLLQSHASTADYNSIDRWLPTDVTGAATLNWLCRNLLVFFQTSLDGRSPVLSLYALYFAGTQAALWMVLMLESLKQDHKKRHFLKSSLSVLLPQFGTYAIFVPLYFAMQPFATSTAFQAMVSTHEVLILPASVIGGFVFPSLAMVLPFTYTGNLFSNEAAILSWQFWPVYTLAAHYLGCLVGGYLSPIGKPNRTAYRYTYGFAIVIAAVPRLLIGWLSILAWLFPGLLNASFTHSLLPGSMFLPMLQRPSVKIESLAQGCLYFLQGENLITGFTTLLWSLDMYRVSYEMCGISTNTSKVIGKTGILCLTLGFMGASVALLWEREELILDSACEESRTKVIMEYEIEYASTHGVQQMSEIVPG